MSTTTRFTSLSLPSKAVAFLSNQIPQRMTAGNTLITSLRLPKILFGSPNRTPFRTRNPNFVVPRFVLRSFYIIALLQRPISWFFHKIGLQLPFNIDSDFDADAQVLQATSTSVVIIPVELIRKILPVVKFEDLVIDRSRSSNGRDTNSNQEENEDDDDDRCVVCLCGFEKQDEVRCLRECFHVFHKSCLDSWMDHSNINNSCPLCRTPFISDQDSLTLLKHN